MALSGDGNYKLETVQAEVELKSNADKFYKIISSQHHDVPKASSHNVHDVAVHEGDWETSGSIKLWKYTLDGNVETFKEKVEMDEANKWVSLTALEGSNVLEQYKSLKIIYHVTPKEEGGSVKITIEYGKLDENHLPPHKYLRLLVDVIQHIDAHLLKE